MELLAAQIPQLSPEAQAASTAPDVSSMLAILRSAGAIPGLDLSPGSASGLGAAASDDSVQAAFASTEQTQQQQQQPASIDGAEDLRTVKAEPSAVKVETSGQVESPGRVKSEDTENLTAAESVAADTVPVLAGDAGSLGAPDIGSNLFALLGQLAPAGQ